jgi:hypothetical protein
MDVVLGCRCRTYTIENVCRIFIYIYIVCSGTVRLNLSHITLYFTNNMSVLEIRISVVTDCSASIKMLHSCRHRRTTGGGRAAAPPPNSGTAIFWRSIPVFGFAIINLILKGRRYREGVGYNCEPLLFANN